MWWRHERGAESSVIASGTRFARAEGWPRRAQLASVVQRTSSDLRLNPHLHVVFLDGSYQGGMTIGEICRERGHLQTRDVGRVLD